MSEKEHVNVGVIEKLSEDSAIDDTLRNETGLPGTLSIVATPIGNLDDLSPRAILTLQRSGLILCEDTRHFGRLAQRFGITSKKRSFHDHNESAQVEAIIDLIRTGTSVSLVSDAGTPLISDPGYRLVAAARRAGVHVTAIPGPSAVVTALSICGFEVDRFYFEGFLPQKSGKRRAVLQRLLDMTVTSVCYESPYRICKTLDELHLLAPEREIFVARELTKMHEEVVFGRAAEVRAQFASRSKILGEFVLVFRRADSSDLSQDADANE